MLKKLTKEYSSLYTLTMREEQILLLLINQVVGLKTIAKELELSRHTVNSHFRSLFKKTKVTSQIELLGSFIKFLIIRETDCSKLHKRPNILIIDDEPDICEVLAIELASRGMNTQTFTDSKEALKAIYQNTKLDAIISDIRMPSPDGLSLLKACREKYPYLPFIFVTGHPGPYRDYDLTDSGAVGVVEKPINFDRLFQILMENIVEDPLDRQKLFRINTSIPIEIEEVFHFSAKNIGFGGVFIQINPNEINLTQKELKVGKRIRFSFRLDQDEQPLQTTGEIIWKRTTPQSDLNTGIGVKFLNLDEATSNKIRHYVVGQKIHSFIPAGKTLKQMLQ